MPTTLSTALQYNHLYIICIPQSKGRGLCTAVNIKFVQRTVEYTLASSVINIIVFSFGAGAANSTLLLHVYGQSMTGAMTELFLFP